MTSGPRALYLCYFGLREPLVQTQVLPYLRELVRRGVRMSLLTFEPPDATWTDSQRGSWRDRLGNEGIDWQSLRYHRRPTLPATLYDIVRGGLRAARLVQRDGIDLLHARSHVGAAIGALARAFTGARLLFDFRGFLAEEYVDSGNWPANGWLYRITKAVERWLMRSSDGFVVLTDRARTVLAEQQAGRPVEVIPCCVSVARFAAKGGADREALRAKLGLTGRVVYVYAGALGGYYMTPELAEFLAVAREVDPRAFALVLTHGKAEMIAGLLEEQGMSAADYRVMRIAPEDMSDYLLAADVALSLVRPSFARQATSPTKFAEYLAAGLPVISTAGVGDLDGEIEGARIGVLLRDTDRASMADACRAAEALRRDPRLVERCHQHVRARYDVETVAGERYRRIYRAVLGA